MNRHYARRTLKRATIGCVSILLMTLCASAVPALAQAVEQKFSEAFTKFIDEALAANRKDLADGVSKSLNDGNLAEAVKVLQQAQQEGRLPSAQALRESLEQAPPQDMALQGAFARDSLGHWRLVPLSATERVHVRALDEIHVSWWRSIVVTRNARKFLRSVAYGKQHSDELIEACLRGGKCSAEQILKVAAYLSAPLEDRVFLIGAGADAPFTDAYIDARQEMGQHVFHYRQCLTPAGDLCSSELIGALAAKSSTFVMADSVNAEVSEYVLAEASALQRLQQGQTRMILIPIEDLMAAVDAVELGTTKAVTAEVYTLSQQ